MLTVFKQGLWIIVSMTRYTHKIGSLPSVIYRHIASSFWVILKSRSLSRKSRCTLMLTLLILFYGKYSLQEVPTPTLIMIQPLKPKKST